MNGIERNRFNRIVRQLNLPRERKQLTLANIRWLLANAWIGNQNNPRLYELLDLIRRHA